MLRLAAAMILAGLLVAPANAQYQWRQPQREPQHLRPGESSTFPDRMCGTGFRRVMANADGTRERKCVVRNTFPAEIILGEK